MGIAKKNSVSPSIGMALKKNPLLRLLHLPQTEELLIHFLHLDHINKKNLAIKAI